MTQNALTQERLQKLLSYDPETGRFLWRKSGRGRNMVEAGSVGSYGYRRIFVDGRGYKAHRLAWLYVHGRFPAGVIDHINRDKTDNRLVNLRDVSIAENTQNHAMDGVYSVPGTGRFRAEIKSFGRRKHIGYFASEDDARAAYQNAKREFHSTVA